MLQGKDAKLLKISNLVNRAAVNIVVHDSFELWFSQGICPVVGLLGRMVVLFLVF